jgi:GNAT superfamily N-acetyltransferase
MRSDNPSFNGLTRGSEIILELLRKGHFKSALREVGMSLHSERVSYGVTRDATTPWKLPDTPLTLSLRPISIGDVSDLFTTSTQSSAEMIIERLKRYRLLKAEIQTCYVATDENNRPCHVHWLIHASQNKKLLDYFHGGFPILKNNEMLLEGGFTVEAYRGKKVMAWAMARLAEKAFEQGATTVIGFIRANNIASLRASIKAGFTPYCTRTDIWRLLARRPIFVPLSSEEQPSLLLALRAKTNQGSNSVSL